MLKPIQNHEGFALVEILTDIQNSLIKEATRQAMRAGSFFAGSHEPFAADVVPDGALEVIPDATYVASRLPFQGTADGPARAL